MFDSGNISILQPKSGGALVSMPVVKKEPTAESDSAVQTSSTTTSLSPLAEFIYTNELREVSISAEETSFSYYKQDGSLAVQSHSQLNYHSTEEKHSFQFTFAAEALGLTAKDFESNNGKPIQLNLSFSYSQSDISYKRNSTTRNTTRDAADIIGDISKAVGKVMSQRGKKQVFLELDEDALKAIGGDKEICLLLAELVTFIAVMNSMNQDGAASHYLVEVSGKGKPVTEIDEQLNVENKTVQVDYNITINPPQTQAASQPEIASTAAPSLDVKV